MLDKQGQQIKTMRTVYEHQMEKLSQMEEEGVYKQTFDEFNSVLKDVDELKQKLARLKSEKLEREAQARFQKQVALDRQ